MSFAQVALDIPTRALPGAYDYAIPPELLDKVTVGTTVYVPFSHRWGVG